jgi:hypothetical protein
VMQTDTLITAARREKTIVEPPVFPITIHFRTAHNLPTEQLKLNHHHFDRTGSPRGRAPL